MTKLMEIVAENLKSHPRGMIADELIEMASRALGREVSQKELDEAMEALARRGHIVKAHVDPGALDLH
jgi:hypothetical protein